MQQVADKAETFRFLGRLSYEAQAEGLLPTAYRFIQSLFELAERHHIAWMTFNAPFQSGLIKQLPRTLRAHGLRLRLTDAANAVEYLIETPYGSIYRSDLPLPELHLKDPLQFLRDVNPLCGLIGLDAGRTSNPRDLWTYASKPEVRATWSFYGASVTDFADPSSYVKKIIYSLTHETFDHLTDWTPVGNFDSTNLGERRIYARHEVPGFDYEGPDLLRLALCGHDAPDAGDELPGILFRRTEADAVEILMIKQLPIDDMREKGAREAWKLAQIDPHYAATYIRTNPGCDVSFELQPLSISDLPADDLLEYLRQLVDQFDRRHATVRELTRVKGVRNQLGGAPPAAVMSLFHACRLFHEQGITRVSMPWDLPWQVKAGDGEVRVNMHSRRTFKALLRHTNIEPIPNARPDYEELSIQQEPLGSHALLRSDNRSCDLERE
jgi:hypothetical protein